MKRTLLVCVGFLFCLTTFSNPVFAKDIKMAIGLALPPYILSETNSGIELDIVSHILKKQGYTIIPKYVKFGSIAGQIVHGKVEGALTILEASGLKNIYYSNSHITYKNVAISLKSEGLSIGKIEDLGKFKTIAFQGATKYLGPVYLKTMKMSPQYREIAKQEVQVARLFTKSTQVLVMDINIFKYFRQHTKKVDASAEVQISDIFPPSRYKVGFVDVAVRDKFNSGLRSFLATDMYDKIYQKYITQ